MMLEVRGPGAVEGARRSSRSPVAERPAHPHPAPSSSSPATSGTSMQHFSAMLYVANGAPVGSGLTVKEVTGRSSCPPGRRRVSGTRMTIRSSSRREQTAADQRSTSRASGPTAEPDTADDTRSFAPARAGPGRVRGARREGGLPHHHFDIGATLDGLATRPVQVTGKASGGVLVRNATFNLAFTVPSVVRGEEPFSMFVTVTNVQPVARPTRSA